MDWPLWVLLLGAVFIVLLVGLVVWIKGRAAAKIPIPDDDAHQNILSAFHAQTTPSLIVKQGKPVFANPAYLALATELGVDVTDNIPPSIERLFAKKERAASAAMYRLHHTTSSNDIGQETIGILDASGNYRAFHVRVCAIEDGQLWQITDKPKDGLADMDLLSEAPIGLFSVTADGTVIKTNSVLRGWLGFKAGAMPENMKAFIEAPEALLDSPQIPGRTVRCDTRLITQKGVVSPVAMTAGWHEMDSGDIYASVAVYGHSGLGMRPADMPETSTLPKENNSPDLPGSSGNNEETAMADIPFGVVKLDSTDLDTAIVLAVNKVMAEMLGRDVTGSLFKSMFVDNPARSAFLEASINIGKRPVDIYLDGKTKCPVDVYFTKPEDGSPETGCRAYIVDVRSRKSLEDKLGQSQKMQTIGQLTGGIAHDFNNLLVAIRLNTDILLGLHPVGDPSYPELQRINQTVSRATGLVRKLLAFSRQQTLRTEVLDVNETLSEVTFLLQDILVEHVKLEVVHGRGLLPIQADKGQFEVVLMNLCVNARDAMLEKGGGVIVLKSAKVSDDELKAQDIEPRKNGGYVRFDVTDTGTGMDKATLEKIFEPFFTTKPQGKGTGLGLATVNGIVEQSGGHLRVDSKPGHGTTFSVYMPTATSDVKKIIKPQPAIAAARYKPSDLAGQGTILFVEDEDIVRRPAAKILRNRGYIVIEADGGNEAYEILAGGEYDFDLLVSDVVMPDMGGPELLEKARDLLKGTPIIFISGFAEETFSELLSKEPDVTFMPKPFSLPELAEKVKSVLG